MKPVSLLVTAFVCLILVLTVTAVMDGGIDFLTPFFGPIPALTWQSQFHVDFAIYMVLSGIWIAWRHGFSRGGLALGMLGAPMGLLFFGPYVLWAIRRAEFDSRRFLLGVHG